MTSPPVHSEGVSLDSQQHIRFYFAKNVTTRKFAAPLTVSYRFEFIDEIIYTMK